MAQQIRVENLEIYSLSLLILSIGAFQYALKKNVLWVVGVLLFVGGLVVWQRLVLPWPYVTAWLLVVFFLYLQSWSEKKKQASLSYFGVRERRILEEKLTLLHRQYDFEVEKRQAELQQANCAIEDNDARLRAVIDHAADAIVSIDESGTILSCNPSARRMFGFEVSEIVGRNLSALLILPVREPVVEFFCSTFLVKGPSWRGSELSLKGIRFDGSEFPIELSVSETVLGRRRFFYVSMRDLTRQIEDAEELLRAKLIADEANEAKTRFLANMSHEIRTPLGAILGFTELLLEQSYSEDEKKSHVQTIKRNGELLFKIVNDVLDLSKVEAGHLEIEVLRTDVLEILRDIEMFAAQRATAKGLLFNISADKNLPRYVNTDGTRVKQVLLNVVNNALKFTDKGEVEVQVKMRSANADKHLLCFSVRDTGRGISPEEEKRLFHPFVQADSSISRKFGGTGLGLVLSRKLARALGGDLVMSSSSPNEGSVFTCYFEVSVAEEGNMVSGLELKLFSQKDEARSDVRKDARLLEGKRILVVDDAPDNRLLIIKMLGAVGAEVHAAENGLEGMEKALSNKFDLILMDIQMPILDGYQTTLELRKRLYNVPIIALTAHAMKEERSRCIKAGCNDHLSKPVQKALLIQKIMEFTQPQGLH